MGKQDADVLAVRMRELQVFLASRADAQGKSWLSILALYARLMWRGVLSIVYQHKGPLKVVVSDVLLLHPSQKSFRQGRKQALVEALRARGLKVEELVEDDDRLVRDRLFIPPPRKVPLFFRAHAAHASYLLNKYHVKVILTERNGWVVPSFIKWFRVEGSQVLHLAHSVPTNQSESYGYFDYDYYLIFGRSSYEYLGRLKPAFGECMTHFAGPYFMDDMASSVQTGVSERTSLKCLFLGSGPKYEKTSEYHAFSRWVLMWLEKHPHAELAIKTHPRGTGEPWREIAINNHQVRLLKSDTPLDRVAGEYDVVLTGYTNAIIDASRQGTPLILLGEGEDYFSCGAFGISRARCYQQMEEALAGVLRSGPDCRGNSIKFFRHHIENTERPLSSLVDSIYLVATGGDLQGTRLAPQI